MLALLVAALLGQADACSGARQLLESRESSAKVHLSGAALDGYLAPLKKALANCVVFVGQLPPESTKLCPEEARTAADRFRLSEAVDTEWLAVVEQCVTRKRRDLAAPESQANRTPKVDAEPKPFAWEDVALESKARPASAADRHLAFSAYICALENARNLELQELREDQRYAKLTGVVDLVKRNQIKLWLQEIDSELARQRKPYVTEIKTRPLRCAGRRVQALSKCFEIGWLENAAEMTTELSADVECRTDESQALVGLVIQSESGSR